MKKFLKALWKIFFVIPALMICLAFVFLTEVLPQSLVTIYKEVMRD